MCTLCHSVGNICGTFAQAMQVSALLSLGQFQLAPLLEQFVGGVVGLNVSHLSVTDLVLYHM